MAIQGIDVQVGVHQPGFGHAEIAEADRLGQPGIARHRAEADCTGRTPLSDSHVGFGERAIEMVEPNPLAIRAEDGGDLSGRGHVVEQVLRPVREQIPRTDLRFGKVDRVAGGALNVDAWQ